MEIASRNVPYLFDFFLGEDGPRARAGRPVDALFHSCGVTLFLGRFHLILDIHALRSVRRWARAFTPAS